MNFAPSSSSYSTHCNYPLPTSSDLHPNPAAADEDLEHMFDKVVTPSDVGKLNRLVIPKQHAERFFPLDPASGDKGLLLTFQDSGGVSWRFRYSYWTSSQSYVITKGWSRFVKDKHLLAGDLVSFHRANGRFYIDWQRRPPDNHHHHPHPFPFFHRPEPAAGFLPPPVVWFRRGTALPVEQPLVFESVPVVHGKAAAKRLRLFGVNMDCPNDDDHEELGALLSSPLTLSQHRRHHVIDHQFSSSNSNGVALELRLNSTASATQARHLRSS